MALFSKGIVLEQHKEPAVGRDILELFGAEERERRFEPVELGSVPTLEQLARIAERAVIVDERDGLPLADKLRNAEHKKLFAVVADAVDDEPYVSSQLGVMLHNRDRVTHALRLCADALGVPKYYILVYKNIADLSIKLPRVIDSVKVVRLTGKYPAENRAEEFFGSSRRKLIIGADALLHLYRAVMECRVQTTCFVTVAGNCVANPRNVEVGLGRTVREVLELCGLALEPTRVVLGGSMTGHCVTDMDTPVNAMTRAVLAFEDEDVRRRFACVGCGRCVEACPRGLNPSLIYKYVVSGRYDGVEVLDSTHCVECGTCTYVCPAKLELSAKVAKAKRYFISTEHQRYSEREKVRQSTKKAWQDLFEDLGHAVGAVVSAAWRGLSALGKVIGKGKR